MWRWWALVPMACTTSSTGQQTPRERDVLIEAFPGGTIVYQDGDGPWQRAPRVGERYGFDVATERYAVAVIDVERRRVDSIYATVAERADIVWPVGAPTSPTHVVSGTIDGLGLLGGRVAGRLHSQALSNEPSQTFALEVADGPQAIVFARTEAATDSLIVRRDVAVAEDLVADADFAVEGQATVGIPALFDAGRLGAVCNVTSTFSFGETVVDLATFPRTIVVPPKPLWRGGDYLALAVSCAESPGAFRTISRYAAVPEAIPNTFEMPYELGGADLVVQEDRRFQFAWNTYPFPVLFYRTVVGARSCAGVCGPRWSSEVTEGWIGGGLAIATTISRPDLEALGLWDPSLELPPDAEWSVAAEGNAVTTDSLLLGETRFVTGESGRLAP